MAAGRGFAEYLCAETGQPERVPGWRKQSRSAFADLMVHCAEGKLRLEEGSYQACTGELGPGAGHPAGRPQRPAATAETGQPEGVPGWRKLSRSGFAGLVVHCAEWKLLQEGWYQACTGELGPGTGHPAGRPQPPAATNS